MQMMIRRLLLDRYDADKDGQLNGEERHRLKEDAEAARREQALAFIKRFDADGDGKLNRDERKAMKQEMEQRRTEQGDKHPGAEDEIPPAPQPPAAEEGAPPPPQQAREHRAGRFHDHPGGRRHQRQHRPHPQMGRDGQLVSFMVRQLIMAAYDADGNGQLDTTESGRLREDGEKLYEAREAELLAEHDTDKDGKLSLSELKAALEARRPRKPEAREAAPEGDSAAGKRPRPWRGHRRSPINRLLDTHFDADILLHLARPQAEGGEDSPTPTPCEPSTAPAS